MGGHELEKLVVSLVAEVDKYKRDIDGALSHTTMVANRMAGLGTKMTLGLTLPLVATAGTMVKMASDAEETASKFRVVFRSVSSEAQAMADTLDKSYGMSSNEAKQLLSNTGDLLTGFGFTQEMALDLSSEVQKLSADLASFQNLEGGAKQASEALTKALLGERESAKMLGIAILEEDVKKRVALLATKGMTFATERQAKAYATLQLAQEQSKNAIGDYARTQGGFANQMREFKADLADVAVQFGQILLPAAQRTLGYLRGAITWVKDLSTEHKTLAVNIGRVAALAGPLLLVLSQFPKVINLINLAIKGMGAAVTGVRLAVSGLRTAFMLAWAAATGPIAPIILGIVAVGAAIGAVIILLVGKGSFSDGWKTVKQWASDTFLAIRGFIAHFGENMGILITWLGENWSSLLKDLLGFFVQFVKDGLSNMWVLVRTLFRLWAAWQGWFAGRMVALFEYVFGGGLLEHVIIGFNAALDFIVKWGSIILPVLGGIAMAAVTLMLEIPKAFFNALWSIGKNVGNMIWRLLHGDFPNPAEFMADLVMGAAEAIGPAIGKAKEKFDQIAGPALAELGDLGGKMAGDFNKGFEDANFLNTAGDIIKEEMAGFKIPGAGYEWQTKGPQFNLELPPAAEENPFKEVEDAAAQVVEPVNEVADAVADVGDTVADVKEEAADPIKMGGIDKGSLDAVTRGTADAVERIAEYRSAQRGALKTAAAIASGAANSDGTAKPTGAAAKNHNSRTEFWLEKIANNTDPNRKGNAVQLEVVEA